MSLISHLHAWPDLPHDDLVRVGGDLGDVAQRRQLHLRLDHPQLGDHREEGAVVNLWKLTSEIEIKFEAHFSSVVLYVLRVLHWSVRVIFPD